MNREEPQKYIPYAVTALVATVLAVQLKSLQDQVATLYDTSTPNISIHTRDAELQAARRKHQNCLDRIDTGQEKIHNEI